MAHLAMAPFVRAILVLDSAGKRIAVKYYPSKEKPEAKRQAEFESELFAKTCRSNARVDAEVAHYKKHVAVYKFCADACFYVVGADTENELVLLKVLDALEESMQLLFRNQVDRATLEENLDLLLLSIDEIIDDGVILETEPQQIVARVAMKGAEKDVPLSEQTFSDALRSARDQLLGNFQ